MRILSTPTKWGTINLHPRDLIRNRAFPLFTTFHSSSLSLKRHRGKLSVRFFLFKRKEHFCVRLQPETSFQATAKKEVNRRLRLSRLRYHNYLSPIEDVAEKSFWQTSVQEEVRGKEGKTGIDPDSLAEQASRRQD